MFEVGEKVVCVDDSGTWSNPEAYVQPVVKGQVYAVREFYQNFQGQFGVRLIGIINPIHSVLGVECGYLASRFRKLSDMQAEARARHSKPENVTAS